MSRGWDLAPLVLLRAVGLVCFGQEFPVGPESLQIPEES